MYTEHKRTRISIDHTKKDTYKYDYMQHLLVQQGSVQHQMRGVIASMKMVRHFARPFERFTFPHGRIQEGPQACHLLDMQALEKLQSSLGRHCPDDYTPAVTAHLHIQIRIRLQAIKVHSSKQKYTCMHISIPKVYMKKNTDGVFLIRITYSIIRT